MRIEELKPGDIVLNHKHSGIYVGIKNGKPCIVHALSGGYHGANVRCTSFETFFKACNTAPVMVYRPKNTVLANKAANYAYQYGFNKDLPFDHLRLIQANSFSDKLQQSEQKYAVKSLDILHETFFISGLFRAIKFTSRRDTNLLKPNHINKPNKGLRCAFFVCLCYQIAALENKVEALSKDSAQWVSNKHINKVQLLSTQQLNECRTSQRYLKYISKPKLDIVEGKLIQKEDVQPLSSSPNKHPNSMLKHAVSTTTETRYYQPAIMQWCGKENLDDHQSIQNLSGSMTHAMMVDAKYVTARELTALLENDKNNWTLAGHLQQTIEKENQPIQSMTVS